VSCVNGVLPLAADLQKIPTLTVVAAALLDGERRILLQQRAKGRAMAGLWEFPGGKVEEGELPEAALVRELEEELGIEVEVGALSPAAFASADNGGRHMLLLLYLCREWRGEPRPLDAAELKWVRPHEMSALPMPPADEPLIPLLDRLL
jgi:8-oxo-dGTP diphosphatase